MIQETKEYLMGFLKRIDELTKDSQKPNGELYMLFNAGANIAKALFEAPLSEKEEVERKANAMLRFQQMKESQQQRFEKEG